MSVELVTGYSGVGGDGQPNRHVSSADDGARQAGTVGTGMYVLGTGSRMGATMEDANTLVVADGDAMINGRHVRIPDTLSFTIPTGVQGHKVANLAVLRYSKAADSVESVTPVVLTGEPDPDSPADPELSEGSVLDGDSPVDMPLYRVVTDGINAGEPEAMFDVMLSMAELRDSVSQPSEWVQLATGCWYAVKAGWCCVSCEGLPLTKGQQRLVGRLPVGAPAGHNVVCPLIGYDSSGGPWAGTVAHLTVNAAGNVFGWTNGATGSYQGTVCFPVG